MYYQSTTSSSGTTSLPLNNATTEPRIEVTEKNHHICKLPKAIEFGCVVNGKELTASLTHAEDDFTQYLYHVQFSDGYKAVFIVNPQLQKWVEAGQSTPSPYASAISEDLFVLNEFSPLYPPFCLFVTVKEEKIKVWATTKEGECYYVFFKGHYRFFLQNFDGPWTAEIVAHPNSYIVKEIAMAVIQHLR